MIRFLVFLLTATALAAQTPGVIVVGTTITATSGSGATALVCTLSNPQPPSLHLVCSIGGSTVASGDFTPAVGATNGFSETFTASGNSVTLIAQQPSVGNLTWQLSANGTMKSGSF